MRKIKAVLCGALLWVLIFFEVSIIKFGLGLTPGLKYYIIHYTVLAILTITVSLIYFHHSPKGLIPGFFVSLVFLLTGIILDGVITVPLFVKTYLFLIDPFLLLGYMEGIIIVSLVGHIIGFSGKKEQGKTRFLDVFRSN